jgi:hypothetical protein
MKRLLIELAIIAALIAFGWNKPFGERVGQTSNKVNATLDEMGGDLQKNQDASVKRY